MARMLAGYIDMARTSSDKMTRAVSRDCASSSWFVWLLPGNARLADSIREDFLRSAYNFHPGRLLAISPTPTHPATTTPTADHY